MVTKAKRKSSAVVDKRPGAERPHVEVDVTPVALIPSDIAISRPSPDIGGNNSGTTSAGDASVQAQVNDGHLPTGGLLEDAHQAIFQRPAESCPYCESTDFVKRGVRKNKFGEAQMYLCRNPVCGRTFTARDIKGKKFPLRIVIDAMSYYNLGFTLEYSCALVKKKFGSAPDPQTLSGWIEEYKPLCRYERLRPYAVKYCKPIDTVEVVTMAHRQLYRFRYHRAKTYLMLEEFRNRSLKPIKEYLDSVSSETPHQYFQEGGRMSEIKSKFDKADMIVKSKENFANHLASFVLKAVTENKQRHEELQRFFIANDSCTVATEVPVYIRREDIEHMESVLKFKVTDNGLIKLKRKGGSSGADVEVAPAALVPAEIGKTSAGENRTAVRQFRDREVPMPRLLTGHIDFVQIRNGCVHLLDYKPNAAKEQPIEQLTWYAMAMSRLTGLRLFEFKCGWFDEKDYFEFYPLHVVKKLSWKKKRFVRFRDGRKVEVPSDNRGKVEVV